MRRLETISAVEALEVDLGQRILDGNLTPGEHLRETELAAEYGVGRHTLRVAFDRLARRGLLDKQRNRGVFVRVLTNRDLAETCQVRTALEAEAFRALTQKGHLPPAACQAVADLGRLDSGSPQRSVVAADLAFHCAVIEGTGNQHLVRAYEALHSEIQLLLAQLVNRYATASGLAEQHSQLLDSIRRGDPAAAETAIREHLRRGTEWLVGRQSPGGEGPSAGDGLRCQPVRDGYRPGRIGDLPDLV
ncbi:MAG TPA: GntR family transcriptional regulator [Streptosporangiaceae bacterium]